MLSCYRKFGGGLPDESPSDYVINRCFSFSLGAEDTLVTTNQGGWVILNKDEYNLLFNGAVEKDTSLYAALEQTGIILTLSNQANILRISCEQHAYLNRAPTRLVIWSYGSKLDEVDDRLEDIGSKAVDFFLSIPHLHDQVHIEFRGDFLSRYPLIQKIMNYAMIVGCRKKKEVFFYIVSSPHLMTDKIAMDIANRRIQYQAYFDGSDLAIAGLKKIRLYETASVQLLAFPLDHVGQEARLVHECVTLGMHRINVKYADASHPVEKYRKASLAPEAYYHFWKDTLEFILERNRKGFFLVEGQAQELLWNIIVPGAKSMSSRRPCGAGVSQFIIDLTGRILACYCAEWLEMGSVFTDTYDAVITSANGVTARCLAGDLLPKCSVCAFNAYCGHCPIRSLEQHGSSLLEEPDDFECQSYIQMIPHLFKRLKDVEDAKILTNWV